MKKYLFLALFAFPALFAAAQSDKEDIDMMQAMYGKEKKAIVADFIVPSDSLRQTAFWKLYDDYENERKALGQKRIGILKKYADSYASLDDKNTDQIMKEVMTLQKDVDGIIVKYYGKIKASVGVKQAAQFYQLENYLLSATRIFILGNIPFIGELENRIPAPGAQK